MAIPQRDGASGHRPGSDTGCNPITYLLGALGMPVLFIVAFLVGVLTVCFDVAYQASLVRLVERDQLAQGNSVMEGSRSAAQIGGPALGGALVSLLSAPIALVASTFFFTLSFLSIRRIRRPESISQQAEPPTRMRWQIHEGLQLVLRDTFLRTVCLASGVFQFSFAALMTVYLLFLPRTLHLSGAAVGMALAALGPGAMLCVPGLHGSSGVTVAWLMAINFLFGAFSQLVDVTVMAVRQ
jgi:hypothetical protein